MSSDEVVNHSDGQQPSNLTFQYNSDIVSAVYDAGASTDTGVVVISNNNSNTDTVTSSNRVEDKTSTRSIHPQKDTIDGSRLLPPPPPPPPPQTDRFFKPVGIISPGSAAAAAAQDITDQPYTFLGRRDVVTPPVGGSTTHSTITGPHALSSVFSTSTMPQLSPLTIASLRGISSPSNSQISIGSTNPTLLNAVLSKKHYDLTPVMRNTSSDVYCDAKNSSLAGNGENNDTSIMTVTPSSQQDCDGYLHGEHLAFPSDLSRASLSSGPAMPPLQPVSVHRRNSNHQGDLSSLHHRDDDIINDNNDTTYLHMDAILPSGLFRNSSDNNEMEDSPIIGGPTAAVQFPSRKYYSFTTREQYEEACRYDPDSDDDLFIPSDEDDSDNDGHLKRMAQGISPRIGLVPYAPQRRSENFDIEQVPEEELKRIFISRGTSSNNTDSVIYDPDNNASSSFELSAEHKSVSNTSLTSSTIPFGPMRIPSLHMANQLNHDSTASISYTDHEDEDSIVVRINSNGDGGSSCMNETDDASLSSFDSNVNLQSMVTTNDVSEHQDDLITAAKLQLRQHRKRKQRRKKEQDRAMEWLQSVEAHPGNDIAEAASSKFLTTTSVPQTPYYYHHHNKHRSNTTSTAAIPLQRQMSVPANIKSSMTDTTKSQKYANITNRKAPPS